MYLGNIVTTCVIKEDKFRIYPNIESINKDLPTLIVGWDITKELMGDKVSILHKKINEKLYWTFSPKERKVDYDKDIISFKKLCYNNIGNDIPYVYLDILHGKLHINKKIIQKIYTLTDPISYISKNNMLYIFGENIMFGVDLNICVLIGIKKEQITERNWFLTFIKMESTLKIITLASFVVNDKIESFKKYLNKRFKTPEDKIFIYSSIEEPDKKILTFRVYLKDGKKINTQTFVPTTIIVHKKGDCFYTINALNKLIESEVEDLFGDTIREQSQGIDSSDENACIRNIERRFKDINVQWDRCEIRTKINDEMHKIEASR